LVVGGDGRGLHDCDDDDDDEEVRVSDEEDEDAPDINDLMGKRVRCSRVRGMTLSQLKLVHGIGPLMTKYMEYSTRDLRTLQTHHSVSDSRKHTNLGAIGQYLNIVKEDDDFEPSMDWLVIPRKVRLFCERLAKLPYKSLSKKKKCDYISSVYRDMDKELTAEPTCFGVGVSRKAVEQARAIVAIDRTKYQRQWVAEGGGKHYQSEWIRRGKWVERDDWRRFGERILKALDVADPITVEEAMWYQALLVTALCFYGGGMRTEVLTNLYLEDLVDAEECTAIRIVSEKTTTKDANLVESGKSSAHRQATAERPSHVSRTIPVPLDCQEAMRNWVKKYRRIIAVQTDPRSTHQKFAFLNSQGRCLRHSGGLSLLVKRVSNKLLGRELTVMDIRHLRVTWVVRSVMSSKTMSQDCRLRLLDAQARLAGHTVEVMMSSYYIHGGTEEADSLVQACKELNELI
jgi:hypothetical protein